MRSSLDKYAAVFIAALALCSAPARADIADALPQAMQSNGVTYVTGGIGDEERDALKAVEHDYNLHVMSAGVSGAFVGDTRIVILNHQGDELVSATAGPIFYATLPPGHYVVEASSSGQERKQDITITSGGSAAHVHFSWR